MSELSCITCACFSCVNFRCSNFYCDVPVLNHACYVSACPDFEGDEGVEDDEK